MRKFLVSLSCLLTYYSIMAQNLREDFNYMPGVLTTQSGNTWSNYNGPINELMVTAGGLSYPNYYSTNATNKIFLQSSNTEKVSRSFVAINGGATYLSFLINLSGNTGLTGSAGGSDYFIALNNIPTSPTSAVGRVYKKVVIRYPHFSLA